MSSRRREEAEGWQAKQKVYVRINVFCCLVGTRNLGDTADVLLGVWKREGTRSSRQP